MEGKKPRSGTDIAADYKGIKRKITALSMELANIPEESVDELHVCNEKLAELSEIKGLLEDEYQDKVGKALYLVA